MNQLLIALRFYATGTHQLVVGDTFSVSKATVCRTVHKVTAVIASLRSKYVTFPATRQERRDVMNMFLHSQSCLVSLVPLTVPTYQSNHQAAKTQKSTETESASFP